MVQNVITILVFYMLIISGSAVNAAMNIGKPEEVMPITSMGIIVLLFFAGTIGLLKAGAFIVLLLCIYIYIYIYLCGADQETEY